MKLNPNLKFKTLTFASFILASTTACAVSDIESDAKIFCQVKSLHPLVQAL